MKDRSFVEKLHKEMDRALEAQRIAWEEWYYRANGGEDIMWEDGENGAECKHEEVHRPAHYTYGKFECWDVIDDWGLDYYLGTALKYICRAGRKGDKKVDLMKAREFIDRAISKLP